MLALLRRRDFALLWSAGLISAAGDWVMAAALPYFVFARTGSTVATAGMIAAELAPAVVLGSAAGVYVDRWDRRRILVAANLAQVAIVLVLLAGRVWLVYAVGAAQSVAAAFAQPAESALLPALVSDAELVPANALAALENRLARLVGVPIGGVLLGLAGLRAVVLVDALTFLAAAALVSSIAAPAVERALPPAFWRALRDGLVLVRRERGLGVLFAVLGLMTFGGTMLDPLQPAWVRDVLGRGPSVYGTLLAVHALFGIGGTLVLARVAGGVAPRHLIGWSSLVAGVALVVRFNVPSLPLAYALTAVSGVSSVVSAVGVQTLVQQRVRADYRGRVFGALGASGALLSLAGALAGGAAADAAGVVPVLDAASALVAVAGIVVLRVYRPTPRLPLVRVPRVPPPTATRCRTRRSGAGR